MLASEGRYYLICNNDRHENVANYRIDRIMNVELLETRAKPRGQVAGLEDGLNLQDYVYQNLNMFSGRAETAGAGLSVIRSICGCMRYRWAFWLPRH